ncbi:hypothetical protein BK133_22615 [Paenibacillus sp. FSL H8-0548]|nr:hypothetical protein BK133_22615 [Paenibacillus sp. FSL H8-0548]
MKKRIGLSLILAYVISRVILSMLGMDYDMTKNILSYKFFIDLILFASIFYLCFLLLRTKKQKKD